MRCHISVLRMARLRCGHITMKAYIYAAYYYDLFITRCTPAFPDCKEPNMENQTTLLMDRLFDAWANGASIYKDDEMLAGVPQFRVLCEDSHYMLDVEDNGSGHIVRINFQKIYKDVI